MQRFKPYYLALTILSSMLLIQTANAITTTPAEQDKLQVHVSVPKRMQDSLFSYSVEWRIDDNELYRSTGISFLNAAKQDANSSDVFIAKKLLTSFKDGMIQLDPNWRGVTITQPQDQPELVIANKTGYSITTITFRDYSNQVLSYDLAGKTFTDEGVQIGIDMVLTADVEYVEGYTTKKAEYASQGEVIVHIDGEKTVHVKTDGKTTRQIEDEIALQLGSSHLSIKPLYEGLVSTDTRNNKPFDGSEVQLLNLAAKSISIEVTDPALGVLTKFKFKDENHTVKVIEPRFMLGVLVAASLFAVGFTWFRKKNKAKAN